MRHQARRLSALFALALVAAIPGGAHAKAPAECTEDNARPVTIAAVNQNLDAWRGECVAIDALLFGRRLYINREATLGDPEYAVAQANLWLNPDKRSALPLRRPAMAHVIGRIGSCKDANDWLQDYSRTHPGEIVMLTGLCHYTLGNYIRPGNPPDLDHAPVYRLTEADVAPDRRPLRPVAAADLLAASPYIAAARQWLAAFATGDHEAALKLEFAEYDELMAGRANHEPFEGLEDQFKAIRARHGRLAASRLDPKSLADHPSMTFVENTKSTRAEPPWITCWCKGPDCKGKWPIAARDADNDPARPYFCAKANDYIIFQDNTAIQVEVPLSSTGFAEPRWPG